MKSPGQNRAELGTPCTRTAVAISVSRLSGNLFDHYMVLPSSEGIADRESLDGDAAAASGTHHASICTVDHDHEDLSNV
jgi:hypothetical protein